MELAACQARLTLARLVPVQAATGRVLHGVAVRGVDSNLHP